MDQITPLLQNDLAALLMPIMLGVRALYTLFLIKDGLPTLPRVVIPVALLLLAEGLAYSNAGLQPDAAATLAGLWWVQGLLFWIGLLLSDAAAGLIYGKAQDASKSAAGGLKLLIAGALGVGLLFGPTAALADSTDVLRWDPKRLSGGVTVWGVVHGLQDGEPAQSSLDAGAYINWNLSRRLNVSAGADHDFTLDYQQYRAGATAQLHGDRPQDRFHLFMGAYYVHYDGQGATAFPDRDSWQAMIQGAWTLAETRAGRKWLAAILSGRYDPVNDHTFGQLGLRVQAFGGSR